MRAYRIYAIGNCVSLIGWWMQRIGVGWLTWELTESGAWLGLIALADLAPSLILAAPAGVLADRYPRLRLMIWSQVLMAAQAAVLAVMTALGAITTSWLLLLAFVLGCISAMNQPARLAFVSSLLPPDRFGAGIAINSGTFNLARLIGPMLAGYTIVLAGVATTFAINALSFVVFIVALLAIGQSVRDERIERAQTSMLASSLEGFRYVAQHEGIRQITLFLAAQSLTVRCYAELLPGFADGVFERGAVGLAWLSSAVGLGAVAGSVMIAARGGIEGLTRIAIAYTLALTVTLIAFSAAPSFWLALIAATVAGYTYTVSGVAMQTLVQSAVAPAFRGRVLSVYGMTFRVAPAVGAFLVGLASEFIGLRWAMGVSAALCLGVWAHAHLRRRRIAAAIESRHGEG